MAPIENVCYISADTGGTKVFLKDRTAGYVGESLTQLMEELDPAMFVRANRQYVVALDAIKAFEDTVSNRVCNLLLREPYDGVEIQIPTSRKKELMGLLY